MQTRWTCVHLHENVCILCKLDGNAHIFTRKMCTFSVEMHAFSWNCKKMCAFSLGKCMYFQWKYAHFHENARKCMHFHQNARKCTEITDFQWEVPFSFKTLLGIVRRLLVGMGNLIFTLCTQLTPFKTIWPNFINEYPSDFFQDHMTWFLHCVPAFINVYPIDSFQHHMTWFLHCVHKLTPFKTIWPNFINVYPIDPFPDHMTWFLHCVPAFINMYPIHSFQHHMTWFLHCVHNWLLSRPFDLILSMCT